MRTSLSVLLLGLCVMTNGLFAQTSDSLSLDTAVQLALENSITLKQADAQSQAAEARVSQSRSDFLPRVTVSADYTRIGPVPAFAFPGFGTIPLAPEGNINAHVTATQTLVDLGLRSAKVEASKSSVALKEDGKRAIRSALVFQVKQAFYTVMLLERSVLVQDQQIASLNEHLKITRQRVESGSATDFDALSTSVRVAQAENVRIDLERSLNDQRIVLRKLLGLPWSAPALVRGTLYAPLPDRPLDSLLERAMTDRPDLIAARHAVASSQAEELVARRGDDPVLRLHAAYGLNNGYEPNIDVVRGNWAAGVQLEVPVFDGMRTEGKVEEAMAMERSAEEHLRDLKRSAESEVRQVLQSVVSARAKISTTDLQVQEAEAAVANARVRYESGAGTNLDLLDAETNVAAAHLQQLQARYQYVLAHVALDAATGVFGK
jgi:outer membrane protein